MPGLQARKIPGRKTLEVRGPESLLWHIMFKSRIAEDIQVRITQPFLARGEKELETNLQKIPWHCYLPDPKLATSKELQFKMPQTRAKCHESKLYHTQMVRDILIETLTETQIRKDFKLQMAANGGQSYKTFKKEWLQRRQKSEKEEVERITKEKLKGGELVEVSQDKDEKKPIRTLDEMRAGLRAEREFHKNLKELSKVQVNIVKDKAEILLSTSHDELHKHGYKPFVRWGVLKETLTAACILESGIIQKANKTGKLYLWDPFCGSGSFLIETLMMLLDQPVRNFQGESQMPFEYWPIHQSEAYQQFKDDLNDFQKMKKRHEIDIQIIGSDISQRAVDTTIKNVEYAEIQQLCEGGLMTARTHGIINDPLVLAKHWPTHSISNSDSEETGITPSSGSASLANFGKSTRDVILSTYQGDFQDIGYRLAEATDNFLDFSILTNVPYGVQSKVKQRQTDTDLHHLYRRFGRFLRLFPNIEYNAFVLAQAHHYGHKLSFEKFSNCGWRKEIAFTNGGIGVHLLRLDMSQLSETKQTIDAYKEIDALPENNAEPTGRGKSVLE